MFADWLMSVGGTLKLSDSNGALDVISDGAGNSRVRKGGVRETFGRTFGLTSGEEGTVIRMMAGGREGSSTGTPSPGVCIGKGVIHSRFARIGIHNVDVLT